MIMRMCINHISIHKLIYIYNTYIKNTYMLYTYIYISALTPGRQEPQEQCNADITYV